jgi:hypothetical protein
MLTLAKAWNPDSSPGYLGETADDNIARQKGAAELAS